MEDQEESNQGAIINQEKNLPHGIRENVPTRTGISEGKEEEHPIKPQDDLLTENRRARYGEDPPFVMQQGESVPQATWDVNNTHNPAWPTRDEELNKDPFKWGSGRAMVA